MKALHDESGALADGLRSIRAQFHLPERFPPEVEQAAAAAAHAARLDGVAPAAAGRVDLTDVAFVTLDPATSTDLDQAFHLGRDGETLVLDYAIADVGAFVAEDSPITAEAWQRGTSQYLPDGKIPLYPSSLTDGAASLLPDGPRPAIVLTVALDTDGRATLRSARRAIVASRAKLAYDRVGGQLPAELGEWAARVTAAEDRRGATRIEVPEQEVRATPTGYELTFAPRLASEDLNATLSLAANLAVADTLYAAHTGLFRVMAEPDERAVARLRHTAAAFALPWPAEQTLGAFARSLRGDDPKQAAMLLAIRRAGGGAGYAAYDPATKPWHAAVAATYAHATAPLRRLADRYVLEAVLAVANATSVPSWVSEAFAALPGVMRRADDLDGQLGRAVIDLAEAVTLAPHVGEAISAIVVDVDERGAQVQLVDYPVIGRVVAHDVAPGAAVTVVVDAVDAQARRVTFRRIA